MAEDWRSTFDRLRADRNRLAEVLLKTDTGRHSAVYLHPSFICVVLHRVSRQFHLKKWGLAARLVAHLNQTLTGADISPESDIGGGLVVVCPPGTSIYGKAGRNLTVMPCSGIGGEMNRREDIGGGPGQPVLGDDVILEPHSGVLGPVRVGDRVRVGGQTLVKRDTPDDTSVECPPPRMIVLKRSL